MTDPIKNTGRRMLTAGAVSAAIVLAACLLLSHAGFGCLHCGPPAVAPTIPRDLLAGTWEGRWASTECDMDGKLRCEVRKHGEAYQADFHAQFAKVLTHDSSVTLRVKEATPGRWTFEGEKDLGVLSGGVYTYKGYVTADEFFSTYDSSYDKGTFRMTHAATSQPATTKPATGAATQSAASQPSPH